MFVLFVSDVIKSEMHEISCAMAPSLL